MTIRNGIYTEYKRHELKLVESRTEVLIPIEKKTFQIWYNNSEDCPFDEFVKDDFNQDGTPKKTEHE